jgi:hypothetical protein
MHVLIRARSQKSEFRANSLGTYAYLTRARVARENLLRIFVELGLIDLGRCAIFCRLCTRNRLQIAVRVVLDKRMYARTHAHYVFEQYTICGPYDATVYYLRALRCLRWPDRRCIYKVVYPLPELYTAIAHCVDTC